MWNASAKPLTQVNLSGVPNMSGTLVSWLQPLTFNVVTKEVVNYEVVETTKDVSFKGVWQPLSPEKLILKPESQRSWKWFQVHSQTSLSLKNDDVIKYRDVQYRVMENLNYVEYGYFEYHIVEDHIGSGPTVITEVQDANP